MYLLVPVGFLGILPETVFVQLGFDFQLQFNLVVLMRINFCNILRRYC